MINQYGEKHFVVSKKVFFLLFSILVISIMAFVIFRIYISSKSFCGNKICEVGENSENCCLDCGCKDGKECSNNVCMGRELCGNGICESSENCYDCPLDCKCENEEYCSMELKKCILPECGNKKCEPFEGPNNCCLDCGCTIPAEICNLTTKKCEMIEVKISDEEVRQIVTAYFQNKGKEIVSMKILRTLIWGDKIGKGVRVEIKNEWGVTVLVTEEGEVIELPTT